MKKKLLSLAMALALCLGLTVPVFAETKTDTVDGITFTANSNGTVSYTGSGTLTPSCLAQGAEELYYLTDGLKGISEVTVNIGPGITNVPEDIIFTEVFDTVFYANGVKSVKLNSKPGDQAIGNFTDVRPDDYFAVPVVWAVDKKITVGTSGTTFSPNQNCTVAQILSFLWRANGSPKPAGNNPFSDVKSGDYYADAAIWAHEKGIVSGSTFGGDRPCTRSMAVTYIWKAAGTPYVASTYGDFTISESGTLREYHGSGGDVVIPHGVTGIRRDAFKGYENTITSVTIPSSVTWMDVGVLDDCATLTDVYWEGENDWAGSLGAATNHYNSNIHIPALSEFPIKTNFTDIPDTADYASAVAWAVENEVTSGTSATTFSPDNVCTRGQIVSFLYRALAK